MKGLKFISYAYMNFLVFLFIKERKSIIDNKKTHHLFPFLLVYMTFVNFTMLIPSLGSRYFVIVYPLIAYIWLVSFKGIKYRWALNLIPIALFYTAYEFVMNTSLVIDFYFFASNFFYIVKHTLFI